MRAISGLLLPFLRTSTTRSGAIRGIGFMGRLPVWEALLQEANATAGARTSPVKSLMGPVAPVTSPRLRAREKLTTSVTIFPTIRDSSNPIAFSTKVPSTNSTGPILAVKKGEQIFLSRSTWRRMEPYAVGRDIPQPLQQIGDCHVGCERRTRRILGRFGRTFRGTDRGHRRALSDCERIRSSWRTKPLKLDCTVPIEETE